MILHIVKKDLRRLWPLVATLVLVHVIFVAIQLDLFAAAGALRSVSRLLGGSTLEGPMVPAVNIIHLLGFFLAAIVFLVLFEPLEHEKTCRCPAVFCHRQRAMT